MNIMIQNREGERDIYTHRWIKMMRGRDVVVLYLPKDDLNIRV